MKYGVRKPSIKKSIKARTTGKVKRQIKKSVNPLYGKKGMGIINDPKKAMYNSVYKQTTVGVSDIAKNATSSSMKSPASSRFNDSCVPMPKQYSDKTYSVSGIIMIVLGIALVLIGLLLLLVSPIGGVIAIAGGVISIILGRKYRKIVK